MANPFDLEEKEPEGLQLNRINSLRRDFGKMWERIDKLVPGRYGALAKTDLEQSFNWILLGLKSSEK